MTVEQYREKYGAEYRRIHRMAFFQAFMQMLNDQHPLKKLKARNDGEKLNGAALFLSQIDGYEQCLSLHEEAAVMTAAVLPEQPNKYAEEEIQTHA